MASSTSSKTQTRFFGVRFRIRVVVSFGGIIRFWVKVSVKPFPSALPGAHTCISIGELLAEVIGRETRTSKTISKLGKFRLQSHKNPNQVI